MGIVFSVYVRSEGWLTDENPSSAFLCDRLCHLQHSPLLQSLHTQVLMLSLSPEGVWNSVVALSMLLCTFGTERNLPRDRLTNCKELWLQEFATKWFLASVLVKTGSGLDSPYLSKPHVLR